MIASRAKHWVWILFPILLSLILYRRSFRIWFLADDFAWLGLRLSIFTWRDLLAALFAPMAQGTIRVFSERLFFLGFEAGFGLESLPMRIWMFATFAVAQAFLVLVAQRLTGSWPAASLAAVLWTLNFGVSAAMCWLSSYNQILLSALVLASLFCFMKFAETARRGWLWGCWATYLLGFGALESIIVLPGILLAWAFLFDRRMMRSTALFFVPAILFTAAHLTWIPNVAEHPSYKMYFGWSLIGSLGAYWQWLLAAVKIKSFGPAYAWLEAPALWVVSASMAAFLVWRTLRRDYVPLFGAIAGMALILPMLPLRDHITDYYLASASIGFALVLATLPLRLRGHYRWAALPILALYIVPSFLVQAATFDWYIARSGPIRVLVRGLKYASSRHPDKVLLLVGVDEDLYTSALADDALRLIDAKQVRLAPGEGPDGNPLRLAAAAAQSAFERDAAIVYWLNGDKLRDITTTWQTSKGRALIGGFSSEVEAGDPLYARQFGEGWHNAENGTRWLSKKGMLTLRGPFRNEAKLYLKGYCPPELGDVHLSVRLNGEAIGETAVDTGSVDRKIAVPARFLALPSVTLEIESSRTIRTGVDPRDLSLVFGSIGIR